MRIPIGATVVTFMGWPTEHVDPDGIPYAAMMARGVVLNNHLPGDYPYEVALDGIDPGPKGVANRYIYREQEVRLAK